MITYLFGRIVEKKPQYLILDCAGIGYLLHISSQTYQQLTDEAPLRIWTHLVIKEDSHTLYGFAMTQERDLFQLLIGVNGVGPSTALSILSSMTISQLRTAILKEDENAIKSVKGIGAKTAKRLIIDLKDKISAQESDAPYPQRANHQVKEDAIKALEEMRYPTKQISKIVNEVFCVDHSVEEVIKLAIKKYKT